MVSNDLALAAMLKAPASKWTCMNAVLPSVPTCMYPGLRSTEVTTRPALYRQASLRPVPSAAAARTDT